MRILALDVGNRRIGLALSDQSGTIAQPFDTIDVDKDTFTKIKGIVLDFKVEKIVFGVPYSMNGSAGAQAENIYDFIDRLKNIIGLPFLPVDERFTTKLAERALRGNRLKSTKAKKSCTDKIAAAIILQGYLDSQKNIAKE